MATNGQDTETLVLPLCKSRADDRLSRRRQVDAGSTAALDPAAVVAVGVARP